MRKLVLLFIILQIIIYPVKGQINNDYKKYLNNGRTAVINGDYELGIKCFDSALQASPTSLIVNKDKGYAEMQLKQYAKAIVDFNKIIAYKPEIIDVYLQRGIAYYHLGVLDSAFNDLSKVLNDNPYHREGKEYLSYVESGKIHIEKKEINKLKTEQTKIEQIRIEKASEREKIIKGSRNPISFWYSVFETW